MRGAEWVAWFEGLSAAEWVGWVAPQVRPALGPRPRQCEVSVLAPERVRAVAYDLLAEALDTQVVDPRWAEAGASDMAVVWVPDGWDGCHETGVRHPVVLRPPGMPDAAWQIYERLRLDGTRLPVAFEAAELLAD